MQKKYIKLMKVILTILIVLTLIIIFVEPLLHYYEDENRYIIRDRATIGMLDKVIKKYKKDNGHFPNRLFELVPIYINEVPKDSCGRSLNYESKGKNNIGSFDLWSSKCGDKDNGVSNFEKT